MFSLIVCSRDSRALAEVSNNVATTIGVPYEIVAIDNSKAKFGICEAYNIGAARAKYDLLCFMHEDIRFHTYGWGNVVAEILADKTIGILGVTGSMHQVQSPAPWWGCGLDLCRENLLNILEGGQQLMELRNPEKKELVDVAVVDGLWLCSRREVWQQYPFDAQTFTDFHFYDIDYCTEIFQHYRICVTYRLLIEHHSRGSVNAAWLRNALKYQAKRHRLLPFGTAVLGTAEENRIELRALQEFTGRLIRADFSRKLIIKYLAQCFTRKLFNRDTLWLTWQFVKRRLLVSTRDS